MAMRYLSLCSGIEAATVAWEPLAWFPAAFAEIEKFPSAVLAHHYPSVPNLGDITQISGKDFRGKIDLIVGGTPCQAFSVAGRRKGMDDPRGQLTFDFLRIVGEARPRWFIIENVPGLLSIDRGRAFGSILRQMVECGYGFAWRVLDAQHFGVPQRRRRLYLIGHLGDWRPAAAVLFERHCLSGHTPTCRGQKAKTAGNSATGSGSHGSPAIAPALCAGAPFARTGNSRVECEALVTQALTAHLGDGGPDDNKAQGGFYIPSLQTFGGNNTSGSIEVSPALNAHGSGSRRMDFESEAFIAHTLRGEGFDASEDGTSRQNLVPMTFAQNQLGEVRLGNTVGTLNQNSNASGRNTPMLLEPGVCAAVRRLTPKECERLQGFPDDYTLIPWRGKPAALCPDGPRYKALGNSMAVPVMRWLGERIIFVEKLMAVEAA